MSSALNSLQRRKIAANRILQRNAYLEQQRKLKQQQVEEEQRRNASVLEKVGATIGDIFGNVFTGAAKGIEGIVDFGSGIVGAVGGIFDKNFQNQIQKNISYDWVGNNIQTPLDNMMKESYLNDWGEVGQFVKSVSSGVGQMLPAVAMNIVAPGSSLITMGVSAAGNATETAFNDGADYYRGLMYGGVSGAVEGVTEKLFANSLTKSINKSGWLDSLTKNIGKSGVAKIGKEMLEEGAEEALAEIANPLTQTIYKGKEALKQYGEGDYWKGVGEAAAVGGVTALAFGETVGKVANKFTNADAHETLAELKALEMKEENLFASNQLFEGKNQEKIAKLREQLNAELSESVSKMKEDKRAEFIKKNNLGSILNKDGSLISSSQSIETSETKANNELASGLSYDKRYYDPKLKSKTAEIQADLDNISQDLKKKYNRDEKVSVFSGELTSKANTAYSNLKKGLNSLNRKSGQNINLVLTSSSTNFNGLKTGNKIYISESTLENGDWAKTLVHEYTHFAEGTKEYANLYNILIGNKRNFFESTSSVLQNYDFNNEELNKISEKIKNNEKLSATEAKYFNEYQTEVGAHMTENLLGNEEFIERIVREEGSLAEKILNKLDHLKDVFKSLGFSESAKEMRDIIKARNLYLKAVEASGRKYVNGKIIVIDDKEDESYNDSENKKYSLREISIAKSEYAILRKTIFEKNSNRNIKQFPIDFAYTSNNFYVYENYGGDSFKVIKKLDIEKNHGRIKLISEVINDARRNNTTTEAANTILDTLRAGRRSSDRNSSYVRRGDSDNRNGRLFGRESKSNTEQYSQTSSKDKRKNLIKKTAFGEGYAVDGINADEYNLISFKNDTRLEMFDRQLTEVEKIVKGKNQNTGIRFEIFDTLKFQENNVYSKLIEINSALTQTKESYVKDNTINIRQEFIKNLGYNGLLVKENSRTDFESVIYDLDNKKHNLLDYSKDRAKARLDKAIKLFGETDNPLKAGWLLSDGRFVDYNRDSKNILGEADAVLDYQDHFQIEKVYDSRRGTDAIDAFMAEGNIRLMPEGNGIELRNMPTEEQIKPLRKYIDKLSEKGEDIVLDLRKPGTSENVLPNFVYYSPDKAITIMSDIFSYYHNDGYIPRVIEGRKFSLTKKIKDVDENVVPIKLQSAIIDFVIDDVNNRLKEIQKSIKQNEKLLTEGKVPPGLVETFKNDLKELKENERRSLLQQKSIQEQRRTFDNNSNQEWELPDSYSERLREITQGFGIQENNEAKRFLIDVINSAKLYKDYPIINVANGYTVGNLTESIRIVDYDCLPKNLVDLKQENQELGIRTWFFIDPGYQSVDVGGFYVPNEGKIFLLLDDSNKPFNLVNRHEKLHYFEREYPDLYKLYKEEVNKVLTQKEQDSLYEKYLSKYKEEYSSISIDKADTFEKYIWGEVYANIYSLVEVDSIKDKNKIYKINEDFDKKLKGKFNIEHDIQYSLKRDKEYHQTQGQVSKLRANYANPKVYSREDAERVVNGILGNGILELEDKFGSMKGKTKAEAIDKMFITLNKVEPGKKANLVRDMAEFVVNNATYEDIYEDDTLTEHVRNYEILKELRGKLNLDHIKDEIKHRYDNKAGSIILQWGKQKGKYSQEIDSVAQELNEIGITIEATTPADQLFEIIDKYNEARDAIKKKIDKYNAESFDKSSKQEIVEEVVREIYAGLDKYGEKSKFTERVEKYTARIKQLSERIKENYDRYKLTNSVLDKVQGIKDWKLGTFVNASKFKTDTFKKSIEELAKIKFRGNINRSGTREILIGLNEFYNKENPILGYQKDSYGSEVFGYYNEEVKFMLEELSKDGNAELSVQELKYLAKILDYFKKFLENYNKIYKNGIFVDALPIAKDYVEKMHKNQNIKVGWWPNLFNKIFNNNKASYLQTFGDPMTVARYFDKYEDGFYTEMLTNLRNGAINASVMEMEMREQLDFFLEKNKNFGKDLKNRTIKYESFELPAQTAFLLYMTLNREQAQLGLANSGFSFEDTNGVFHRVDGFNVEGVVSTWEISNKAQEVRKQLEAQFTDVEKQYIKIAEKIFNEDCKEAKMKTDILRTGYSNVSEDYYVPIHRANIAKTIDNNLYHENDRVSNLSFNKNIVKGAQGELFIDSLDKVLNKHIREMSQYANLSTIIEQFDILFNLDILDNGNKPINIKSESVNVWRDGYNYFRDLLSDLQGISRVKGKVNNFVGRLRSGFAKFQLGANPKVWATQFSSLFASSNILDYDSLIKGFTVSGKDVDNYCKLAKLRNYDNSAALAQGVLDKVDKVGDFLMKPIGKTDRLVITKLFGACQIQVEKNNGLKVGTEENKTKAGKLLTKVILETQQNSLATERSNAMRDSSEFMKALTMFTADAMKVVGRFVDGIGEYSVLKAKIKQTTDSAEKAKLESKLKVAQKKVVKSSVALLSSAVFMALIAQAFQWIYNKDYEDENVLENMAVDAFGNMLGGLPLIKDLYSKLAEGYDLNNYLYDSINDVLDGFNTLLKFDSENPGKDIRKIVYAIGQVLGLPARNIYNIFYGLTSRVSPEAGYKINDLFYNQSYSADLKKAIENNDDGMISTIVGIMLNERIGDVTDSKTQTTLKDLLKEGYSVLPKSISNSITYDGETIELTKRQQERFRSIYSKSADSISSLIDSKGFTQAGSEVKAKSIKYIYDYYYSEALKDLLGVDSDNKRYLFAQAIDIEKLALVVSQVALLESDKDKDGKTISGSKKTKITQLVNSMRLSAVQKYMLMGYFGYKNANGEKQVKSYIQSLKLTKTEKETLFKMCGY